MKIVREISEWKGVGRQPNHVYLMESDRAYAYSAWGTEKPVYFSKPMRIDKRKRKFVEVKDNPWDFKFTIDKPKGREWQVKSSKGGEYTVREEEGKWSCTCPGFTFRGKCRHIDELVTA